MPRRSLKSRWSSLAAAALLLACDAPAPPKPTPTPNARPTAATTNKAAAPIAIASRFAAADRVVAIGDVHGDLNATRAALKLGGVIDDKDNWVGGTTVVVQTGDVLDRGDGERAIIELLQKLQAQAQKAGGRVHTLHGNHELMNVAQDFRYVTPFGMQDFGDRAAAFRPGGSYARKLADNPVVVVVGDTVYCHGGVLPSYTDIDRINRETAAWLLGQNAAGMRIIERPDSPVWSRHYSDNPDDKDCALLDQALTKLKAKRMVVGHTVQKEITNACGEKIWRVDVGMAAHYGGSPQVLELTADGPRPVR